MPNSSIFLHIARYEFKFQYRSLIFWISTLLVIGVIFLQQYEWRGGFEVVALSQSPSYIPFECAYIYNYLQALILIFVVVNIPGRQKRLSAMEVCYVHPVSNTEWMIGTVLGVVGMFLWLNICACVCGVCVNYLWSDAPFSLSLYFFYLVTLNIPVLFFMMGLSLVLIQLIRHRGMVMLVLLSFLLLVYVCFGEIDFGVWDMWGRWLPNIFSELVGQPNPGVYGVHRLVYVFWGISLLVFFTVMEPRIDEKKMRRFFIALLLLSFGTGGIIWYRNHFVRECERREEYRQVYLEYGNPGKLRVEKHDVSCTLQGDSLRAVSFLVLKNKGKEAIRKPVLYLNPWLQVKFISRGGEKIGFERKSQAVVCENVILPGEEQSFVMEYSGRIDEAIGYLDIPDKVYYDTREHKVAFNGSMVPGRNGKRFAFLGNYTCLRSEALWYPMCVPPINMRSLFSEEKDATRFTLKVVNRNGGRVISQGDPRTQGDTILFEHSNVTGSIMLCAGDYERRSMTVDSFVVDLYYSREHGYMFEGYNIDEEEVVKLLRENFEYWERIEGETVRVGRLLFVEIPLSSYFPERSWASMDTDMQPGVLFFKERGVGYETNLDIFAEKRQMKRWKWGDLDDAVLEEEFLHKLRYKLQHKGAFGGSALRSLYSEKYPAVQRLFEFVKKGSIRGYLGTVVEEGEWERELLDLFTRKNFRELLVDSSLSVRQMERIVYLKGIDFQARLFSLGVSEFAVVDFIQDFFAKYSPGEIDIALLFHDFSREFEIDLAVLLDECYSRVGLPRFMVEYAGIEYSVSEQVYYIHFHVYNDSDVGGVVAMTGGEVNIEFREKLGDDALKYYYYLLEPHQEKYFRIKFGAWCPQFVALNTYLSQNLPQIYSWENQGFDENSSMFVTGEGVGDGRMGNAGFLPVQGEIVVDNEDPGFSIEETRDSWQLAWIRRDRRSSYNDMYRIERDFYGYPIRSAVVKRRGTGNWKAVWRAELERSGRYEVFIYRTGENNQNGKYYYTIYHGEEKEEMVVAMDEEKDGWVSLGDYVFPQGEVKIELDDRGRNKDILAIHDYIIADAVKWVYRGE